MIQLFAGNVAHITVFAVNIVVTITFDTKNEHYTALQPISNLHSNIIRTFLVFIFKNSK